MKALNMLSALYNFASFRKIEIDEAISELQAFELQAKALKDERANITKTHANNMQLMRSQLEALQKENEKLRKDADCWKLSFNKQLEASRKPKATK